MVAMTEVRRRRHRDGEKVHSHQVGKVPIKTTGKGVVKIFTECNFIALATCFV